MNDNLVLDAAGKLFDDLAPAALKLLEKGERPDAYWRAFGQSGFADVLAGAGWSNATDAIAVLRAAGRAAAPGPIVERMLACKLADKLKLESGDEGRNGEGNGDGKHASGASELLAAFPAAAHLGQAVVAQWPSDGQSVFALLPQGWARLTIDSNARVTMPSAASATTPAAAPITKTYAGEPQQLRELDGVALTPYPADASYEQLQLFAALARAAQMHGAMEHILALTGEYANTRVQFGKALSKQQAVQHQLALMAEEIAATGVAVEFATRRMAQAHDANLIWQAVASAKIRSGEAAGKVAETTHQIHGAIGFTQEYQLQHYTRRLWTWRDEFGAESEWAQALGKRLSRRRTGQIWGALTE